MLEHAVSDRLLERIDAALGRPVRDPHGDPIPTVDGRIITPELRSIDTLRVGQTGVVGRIKDNPQTLRHLARAGIGLDTPVTVVERTASGVRDKRRRATTVRAVRAAGTPAPQAPDAVVPARSLWVLT